jgi:hypothetical protein
MSVPDRRLLWPVYGSLLVPFIGPAALIVASSVFYYAWRLRDPDRARWLNRHAWAAIGLNVIANVGLLLVKR